MSLLILGWVVCGVIAVGMTRHYFDACIGPDRAHEPDVFTEITSLVMGPLGILAAILVGYSSGTKLGLKYRYKNK